MTIARWKPPVGPTRQEQFLLKRLGRVRKLFAFLRRHRHELFDEAFQAELASMYRGSGAGKPALPPAWLAMATLVQGDLGVSDAEMVELTVVDLRVQMVLGCLGAEAPPFSQGALQEFRERLIAADLDRRVLERTVELAKRTKAFDHRKLPKTLRVAIDSSPLEGAGRVEDTYNLLAHAARNVVRCAARLLGWRDEKVCREAGIPLLLESSIKAALDVDWNDAGAKAEAIKTLSRQLDTLPAWMAGRLPEEIATPPLQAHLETLVPIRTQDLEPDPVGGGVRIRQGVAEDRRVSVEDQQMRHGRKSKSKRFNGFKRHIAADVDRGLILACAITPANRPEEDAMPALQTDLARQAFTERQARFLVNVLLHAGVFVERQYCAFAGIVHGQKSTDFIKTLVERRFATAIATGKLHRGRMFHVHYKPLWAAVGEPVRRSKNETSHRVIPLNASAIEAVTRMLERADLLGHTQPEHYLWPACQWGRYDAIKPMLQWDTAWRALRDGAGLHGLRFHDLRHTVITELAEMGVADHVLESISGHLSRRMLEHYSHIRIDAKRQALDALDATRRAPGTNGDGNGQNDSEIEAVVEVPDGLTSQSRHSLRLSGSPPSGKLLIPLERRDVRVVEGARLESEVRDELRATSRHFIAYSRNDFRPEPIT